MENKICKNCNIEKNINEFKNTGKLCRICFNEYMRLRRPKKIKSEKKICKNCNIEKNINEFENTGKLCYICNKEYHKVYDKNYYSKHKTGKQEYHKSYREKNKTRIKNHAQEYYKVNKYKLIDYSRKKYVEKTKDKIRKKYNKKEYRRNYMKNKRHNDILFRLSSNIRSSIFNSFKRGNYGKNLKTEEIIGCSFKYLLEHIENQFQSWMTWNNQGKYNGEFEYGWDIDHIEPLFPEGVKRTPEDIIRLNHYTNLQPLCSKTNRDIKRNNI